MPPSLAGCFECENDPEMKCKNNVIKKNLISDYTVTEITFTINHTCFGFQISFNRKK